MATACLWIGAYLIVLALVINAVLQKLQRKRREKDDRPPK
jgi:hypothetical protein